MKPNFSIRWSSAIFEFENAAGIKGVSQIYKMPEGYTMESLADELLERIQLCMDHNPSLFRFSYCTDKTDEDYQSKLRFFRQTASAIIDLNPELQSIRIDPYHIMPLFDFLLGVVAGYNARDIQYWLDNLPENGCDEALSALREAINNTQIFANEIGLPIVWVPAPQTLDYMRRCCYERS